jgi:hypothetical protein
MTKVYEKEAAGLVINAHETSTTAIKPHPTTLPCPALPNHPYFTTFILGFLDMIKTLSRF